MPLALRSEYPPPPRRQAGGTVATFVYSLSCLHLKPERLGSSQAFDLRQPESSELDQDQPK